MPPIRVKTTTNNPLSQRFASRGMVPLNPITGLNWRSLGSCGVALTTPRLKPLRRTNYFRRWDTNLMHCAAPCVCSRCKINHHQTWAGLQAHASGCRTNNSVTLSKPRNSQNWTLGLWNKLPLDAKRRKYLHIQIILWTQHWNSLWHERYSGTKREF